MDWDARSSLQQPAELSENFKSQISNNKQITMTEIPNSKSVLVIEYWNLIFGNVLSLQL
jgi:hypothetical protein